jgi:hypothetical protein
MKRKRLFVLSPLPPRQFKALAVLVLGHLFLAPFFGVWHKLISFL